MASKIHNAKKNGNVWRENYAIKRMDRMVHIDFLSVFLPHKTESSSFLIRLNHDHAEEHTKTCSVYEM